MNSEILEGPTMSQTGMHGGTSSETSNARRVDAKNRGLAVILADPSMIETLTAEAAASARGELARLDSLLLARLMNVNGGRREGGQPDRRLSVEEAAAKMCVTKDWLYRHADSLPFTVRIGRSVGFSEQGIERYLRQRAGR